MNDCTGARSPRPPRAAEVSSQKEGGVPLVAAAKSSMISSKQATALGVYRFLFFVFQPQQHKRGDGMQR